MSIIDKLVEDSSQQKSPLQGTRLGICLHITKETAALVMAAKKLGANISLCSANPLSAQNDIAAFLDSEGIDVFAWRGETEQEYRACIENVVSSKPEFVIDDGGDLHAMIHSTRPEVLPFGGTEETTSGVKRLKALERDGRLAYPVIAVNNARTKFLFDNRHGTGQSTIDGILRSTGLFLPGKHVVVCGYGWVGKGVADRVKGMGAVVTITEVDPIRALEAYMDGFRVSKLEDAAVTADIVITCTGQTGVVSQGHIHKLKDGAMLANAGHFNVEIDTQYLQAATEQRTIVRENVEEFTILGKRIYLLSEGRVVNLVAAEGNAPEVMALSFANQLLAILHLAKNCTAMQARVYEVSAEIDRKVAEYALKDRGITIDSLTEEQQRYSQLD